MSKENARNKPDLIAYVVTGSDERSYFHRIDAAWNTKNGGARVILDAFPVNGELLLLPPREASETEENGE